MHKDDYYKEVTQEKFGFFVVFRKMSFGLHNAINKLHLIILKIMYVHTLASTEYFLSLNRKKFKVEIHSSG